MVIAAARASDSQETSTAVGDLLLRARALTVQTQSIDRFVEIESIYRRAAAPPPISPNRSPQRAVWLQSCGNLPRGSRASDEVSVSCSAGHRERAVQCKVIGSASICSRPEPVLSQVD
jgi:hypothetical protein